ncbi:hypothetical protein HOP50_07g49160 [Chloropicon primus]|uniref:Uncharacterized protein n=1 Tax=Chloropicon primus TaxID=1764295 RepID=A0A5B8MPM2_9CHLO|nr:hypothetical protein A3770_07p48950 [Chloropicon primus]UPR01594.1 hypothetical protein HOP50_07g49160 [Chloropicon primus]|eukprot:QDZ22377.1 hypothetical protein A3770_07p48950 [Chloropicon primus]
MVRRTRAAKAALETEDGCGRVGSRKRKHVKFDSDNEEEEGDQPSSRGEEEGEGEGLAVFDDAEEESDGVDDEEPEEMPMRSVRKAAKDTRRREAEARSSKRKAEKASKRRSMEKRVLEKQQQSQDLPQDLLLQLEKEVQERRSGTSGAVATKATAASAASKPYAVEAGPVSVVVLPTTASGSHMEVSPALGKEATRESASSFFWNNISGGSEVSGSRNSNALRGVQPYMLVQPRGTALYGPHVDFNS